MNTNQNVLQKYGNIELQRDNKKGKIREVRKLHQKATNDIAKDTQKIIGDFVSVYTIARANVPELRLEREMISRSSKERHVRLQQFHNNLPIV